MAWDSLNPFLLASNLLNLFIFCHFPVNLPNDDMIGRRAHRPPDSHPGLFVVVDFGTSSRVFNILELSAQIIMHPETLDPSLSSQAFMGTLAEAIRLSPREKMKFISL